MPTGGGGGGGGSSVPPPPPPPCQGQGEARNWYEKIPPGSTPPCAPVPSPPSSPYVNLVQLDVVDLDDPCMTGLVAMLGPNGAKTELMKAFQRANTAPNNTDFNIKYITNNSLVDVNGQPIAAHTDVIKVANVANVTISLNNTFMSGMSKEFRMTILIHELVHAMLKAATTIPDDQQHITMFVNHVQDIALSVRAYFPSMSRMDARALAIRGEDNILFDGNGAVIGQYNDYAQTYYFMDIAEAITRSVPFIIGTAGTPC